MGTLKFAFNMLMKELKKSIFFFLTMMIVVWVIYVFMCIISNQGMISGETHKVVGGPTWQAMSVPFASILGLLVIVFCGFMMFYAGNFYFRNKGQQIALLLMSGVSEIGAAMYMIYQVLFMLIIAAPLGIGLGAISIPLINDWMNSYLQKVNTLAQGQTLLAATAFMLFSIMVLLWLMSYGEVHRNGIGNISSGDSQMVSLGDRKKIKRTLIYPALYVLGIILVFTQVHESTAYITPTLCGIIGTVGMLKKTLPNYISVYKQKKLLTHPHKMVSISNLSYTLSKSIMLVSLLIASVTGMLTVLVCTKETPATYVTAIIGYAVIIILLVTAIMYKLNMEVASRGVLYFNMWKIGYTKKELSKVIRQEMLSFFSILIILPTPYMICISSTFISHGEMSVGFMILLILTYVIPIILIGFVTYVTYRSNALSSIQEVR